MRGLRKHVENPGTAQAIALPQQLGRITCQRGRVAGYIDQAPRAQLAHPTYRLQRAVTLDLTGRASVLLVKDDDTIEKKPVELDRAIGSDWLVQTGLEGGERVVVDGFQRIKPGDKVQVVELKADAKPGQKIDPQAAAAALRAAAAQK